MKFLHPTSQEEEVLRPLFSRILQNLLIHGHQQLVHSVVCLEWDSELSLEFLFDLDDL